MPNYVESLVSDFRKLLENSTPLESGAQLDPVEGVLLWRALFRRMPSADFELPHIMDYVGTYREFLTELTNSAEFADKIPLTPAGYQWLTVVDGIRFWFRTDDREMGVSIAMGRYERESVELLNRYARKGMNCIDAGANTGFYTCLMGNLVGPSGKVFAFEPMPGNFEVMLKNVAENDQTGYVKCFEVACSDTENTIEATILSNMFIAGAKEGGVKVQMKTVAVDEIIDDKIDILKIDVEGHEQQALNGMKRIISESKPIIFSEINEYWLQTCSEITGAEYVEYLNDLGYKVFNVKYPKTKLNPADMGLNILETMDIIGLHKHMI